MSLHFFGETTIGVPFQRATALFCDTEIQFIERYENSHFHFFHNTLLKREKTLRTYSVSIDLQKIDPALWVTHQGYCLEMIEILTSARHFDLLPHNFKDNQLRPIDPIEARSNTLTEHVEPKKIIRLDDHQPPASPLDQAASAEP